MRLGLALKNVSVMDVREIATRAESAGFEMLLFPETGHVSALNLAGRDPFLCASAALDVTTDLRAGPAVAATTLRSARAMALTASTIQESSGGRFMLGCGVSHRAHIEALGLPYPSSVLSHATGYIDELRTFSSSLAAFGNNVPIYLAALGPKMVQLAAVAANGIVLNWLTVDGARDSVDRYLSAGPRGGESLLLVRVGPDDELRNDALAYRELMPNYAQHFEAFGLESVDDIVSGTCLPPDPEAIMAGLASYAGTGLSVPCVYPTGMSTAEILDLVAALGELSHEER
jgi:alkanesulfonate monooxygenase SsuD/methylene tetrahydromethanopterin reductase-like flavin-dependent oxidoreductase (luciferase family)